MKITGEWRVYGQSEGESLFEDISKSKFKFNLNEKRDCRVATSYLTTSIYYVKENNNHKEAKIFIQDYNGTIKNLLVAFDGKETDFELLDELDEYVKVCSFYPTQNQLSIKEDMDHLKEIYNKTINNEDLSYEDLVFLYEPGRARIKCYNLGYGIVRALRSVRPIEKDIVDLGITSITPTNCTNFNLDKINDSRCLKNVTKLKGIINFKSLEEVNGLSNVTNIEGLISFPNVTDSKGLENVTTLKGCIDLSFLKDCSSLSKLRNIKGLVDLSGTTGDLKLDSLNSIDPCLLDKNMKNLIKFHKDYVKNGYYDESFCKKMLNYIMLNGIDIKGDLFNESIKGNIISNGSVYSKKLVYKKGE